MSATEENQCGGKSLHPASPISQGQRLLQQGLKHVRLTIVESICLQQPWRRMSLLDSSSPGGGQWRHFYGSDQEQSCDCHVRIRKKKVVFGVGENRGWDIYEQSENSCSIWCRGKKAVFCVWVCQMTGQGQGQWRVLRSAVWYPQICCACCLVITDQKKE